MKTFALLTFLLIQATFAGAPSEAFVAFQKAAQEKNFEEAWKRTAKFDGLPDHITGDLKKSIRAFVDITNKGWKYDVLEEKAEGDCAVLVANESMKDGVPTFDIDPIYLIKQNGEWKIFPDITLWDLARQFAKEKVGSFTKLEVWFEARKIVRVREHYR